MRLQSRSAASSLLLFASGLLLPSALAVGCGSSESTPVAASAPVAPLEDVTGLYKVSGTTAQLDGSNRRRISGTVTLRQEGDLYSSSYNLKTTFPGRDDELVADVVGTGDGSVKGRELIGTSETQLVISTVPGIDTGFAFIPRIVGLRLTSTTTATFLEDGSVTMEVENSPGEGEEYTPTRTVLRGERIAEGGPGPR